MKLEKYFEMNSVNKSKFAKNCGLNYHQILYILRGNIPTLPNALKIINGSRGEVKAHDLLTDEMYKEVYGDESPKY